MVDVINSTELRMIGFEMTCIGVFPSIADEDSDDDEDDKGDVLIVVGSLKVFTSKLKSFDKRLLTVVSFVFSFN